MPAVKTRACRICGEPCYGTYCRKHYGAKDRLNHGAKSSIGVYIRRREKKIEAKVDIVLIGEID